MKKIMCLMGLLCSCAGFGQSLDVQQLLLNIEKLAQMKTSYAAMVKGYHVLESGYTRVSSLTKGNFDLQKAYLDGLLSVNPSVLQNGKVDAIIVKQKTLIAEYHESYRLLQATGMLRAEEMIKLKNALSMIVHDAETAIDEMIVVLTPGKMRMNDEERLGVINRVEASVSSGLEKLRTVAGEYRRLSEVRAKRAQEVKALKALYGIKQ